jgi:hypothetical protein
MRGDIRALHVAQQTQLRDSKENSAMLQVILRTVTEINVSRYLG